MKEYVTPIQVMEGVWASYAVGLRCRDKDFDVAKMLGDLFSAEYGSEQFWEAYHTARDIYNRIAGASEMFDQLAALQGPSAHQSAGGQPEVLSPDDPLAVYLKGGSKFNN